MTQVRVFHRVHVNHRPISAPGWRVRGAAGPAPAPLAPASARLRQLLCSPNFTTASCASFSVPPTSLLHGLRFTRTHEAHRPGLLTRLAQRQQLKLNHVPWLWFCSSESDHVSTPRVPTAPGSLPAVGEACQLARTLPRPPRVSRQLAPAQPRRGSATVPASSAASYTSSPPRGRSSRLRPLSMVFREGVSWRPSRWQKPEPPGGAAEPRRAEGGCARRWRRGRRDRSTEPAAGALTLPSEEKRGRGRPFARGSRLTAAGAAGRGAERGLEPSERRRWRRGWAGWARGWVSPWARWEAACLRSPARSPASPRTSCWRARRKWAVRGAEVPGRPGAGGVCVCVCALAGAVSIECATARRGPVS